MSIDNSINKDRRYYTQNNSPIRIRCPECVRIKKTLRQCKIYKNLPALWCHIKRDHGNISNLNFNTAEIIKVLNGLDKAIRWNIL